MKIGIFGGSFNPPHNGHINSVITIQKKMGLDKVYIVVNNQSPFKTPTEGANSEQRLTMARLAFESYGSQFVVDDLEIQRGGKSYTIDTIQELRKKHESDELFLIIGADQFEAFGDWKDYKKILSEVNVIVTTRPGYLTPETKDELPEFLKDSVEGFDFNTLELKSMRMIQFMTLQDLEMSSTQLRKWLRGGRPVDKYLPLSVENYIKEKKIYRNIGDRIGDYRAFAEFCAQIMFDKKGINVRGYDLTQITAPSEYSLIASGTSTRHASAIAENIIRSVKEDYNVHPQSIEGMDEGRWVLLDYGNLIIHIFYDFVRQEYSIENLWKMGKDLNLQDSTVMPKKT